MAGDIRWGLVNEVIQTFKLSSSNKDANQRYDEAVKNTQENQDLIPSEKEVTLKYFVREKDRENLLFLKGPKYPCAICQRDGYTLAYCEHCLRDCLVSQFNTWTSGNDIIDKALQDSQIKLPLPVQIMEWIPYENLKNIKHLAHGGYGEIYTAIWTKGYIKSFNKDLQQFERSGPWKCILKRLVNSNQANVEFFKEIKLHISLRASAYKLVGCRGVSRDPSTGDYILVLDQMQHDLRHFNIKDHSSPLTMKMLYRLCLDVTTALAQIHKEGLVHKDLHSGNILQRPDSVWVIADLGFCGPPNKPSTHVYGCIPYIAPEILYSISRSVPVYYTSASDMYSIGMLMYEAATRRISFRKLYRDHKELATDVCNGIRPKVPAGLPDQYVSLMKQCWRADPSARPTATELYDFFFEQCKSLKDDDLLQITIDESLSTNSVFETKSALYQFEKLPTPKDAYIVKGTLGTSSDTLHSESISFDNNVSVQTMVEKHTDGSNAEKSNFEKEQNIVDLNITRPKELADSDKISNVSIPLENKKFWKRFFSKFLCKC